MTTYISTRKTGNRNNCAELPKLSSQSRDAFRPELPVLASGQAVSGLEDVAAHRRSAGVHPGAA